MGGRRTGGRRRGLGEVPRGDSEASLALPSPGKLGAHPVGRVAVDQASACVRVFFQPGAPLPPTGQNAFQLY